MRRSAVRLGAAATAVAALVTACSGGDDAAEQSPEQRLTEAKTALDETSGVHLTLETDRLPAGVNGLLQADGIGTHAPAFEGDIKVSANGITADAAVVAVDGTVWAVLPFTTDYAEIDPADYQAPDPAVLMSTDGGLSSLLTSAEDVEQGEQVRDGEEILTELAGTLPGDAVARVIPSARAEAEFEATFTLDDGNRLDKVVMTGPFYPEADAVTYTVELDQYGTEKDITAP